MSRTTINLELEAELIEEMVGADVVESPHISIEYCRPKPDIILTTKTPTAIRRWRLKFNKAITDLITKKNAAGGGRRRFRP
jgi:hypothetical protein